MGFAYSEGTCFHSLLPDTLYGQKYQNLIQVFYSAPLIEVYKTKHPASSLPLQEIVKEWVALKNLVNLSMVLLLKTLVVLLKQRNLGTTACQSKC